MWWFRLFSSLSRLRGFVKFLAALLLCLPLAACGFRPAYGNHGAQAAIATQAHAGGVEIAVIPDREGQYLRNLLMDRLYLDGRPAAAPFLLTVSPLRTELTNLGIRKDATATRGMLQVSAKMTLAHRETNAVVLERDVRAVGGYNQLDNRFATLVSRESLTENMLKELSDTIVTELALYFNRAAEGYAP